MSVKTETMGKNITCVFIGVELSFYVMGRTQTEVSEGKLLLRGVLGNKRAELTCEWRKMRDKELHNL
jgi:hypothetical protein